MISLRDCMEYLHLSPDEVDTIAEHEHVPSIIAAEMANYLVDDATGERRLKRMILDDIAHAADHGNVARVEHLTQVLKHFIATHPDLE
ncbi:MAG: hypothetical protein WD928_12240 [Gammaproteobacteria bacterium]